MVQSCRLEGGLIRRHTMQSGSVGSGFDSNILILELSAEGGTQSCWGLEVFQHSFVAWIKLLTVNSSANLLSS